MTLTALLLLLPALQQPYPLMEVGDTIGGTLESPLDFRALTVNNQGHWRARCTWTGGVNEYVVIQDGSLLMDWRSQLQGGPGQAQWNAIEGWEMNNRGEVVQSMGFVNTPGGLTDNEGLYYEDLNLLQLESDPVLDPAAPAGAVWRDWRNVRFSEDGRALIQGLYNAPGLGDVDCIALVGVTGSGMHSGAELLVVQEGDVLDGDPVSGFRTDHQSADINAAGDVAYFAVLASGSSANNTIIMLNGTVLAREDSPSPVPGVDYGALDQSSIAINNLGEYAFDAMLGSTTVRDAIIVNGQALYRYGDVLPDTAPYPLSYLRNGNVDIADTGDVLWYGQIEDPNPDTDEALFLNDRILVREGVTTIHGSVVDSFDTGVWGMFLTDDGRRAVFEATLLDGSEGLYAIDLAPRLRLMPVDPGIVNRWNTVRIAGADPGALLLLAGSPNVGSISLPCPGSGSLTLDLGQPARKVAGVVADENGSALVKAYVPGSLSGFGYYLQALDRVHCLVSNRVHVTFL